MAAQRTVRLKVSFQVDYEVPADWDDDMVLFHCNESSFCTDNLLHDKLLQSASGGNCACSPYDVELVAPEGPGQF